MKIKTILLVIAGFILLLLGAIGVVLPVLPTTPFVLAAAACFTCVPKLKEKLMRIPFVSDHLDNYRSRKGLSTKTVVVNLLFLWAMLGVSCYFTRKLWLGILLFVVGVSVTTHILHMARPQGGDAKKPSLSGLAEAVFDAVYLCVVPLIGVAALLGAKTLMHVLFGVMALVLVTGDAFHLVPRIAAGISGDYARFDRALARGKTAASVSMTVFYVILWHIVLVNFSPAYAQGLTAMVYALAIVRIVLAAFPQVWGTMRNLPFTLIGCIVGVTLFVYRRSGILDLRWMWLGVLLSFMFYLPVVLWAKKHPALGMLMIPKSCVYVWMLAVGLTLDS